MARDSAQGRLCTVNIMLTIWHLTTTIVVVPHRYSLNVTFYIFIQQI